MAGSDTNPLYLAWKMLPPEVRKGGGPIDRIWQGLLGGP